MDEIAERVHEDVYETLTECVWGEELAPLFLNRYRGQAVVDFLAECLEAHCGADSMVGEAIRARVAGDGSGSSSDDAASL